MRSTVHLLFGTATTDQNAGGATAPALPGESPVSAANTSPASSQPAATIAAGAAFQVGASGQITTARFQLETRGISPELAAKLVARLAATSRATAQTAPRPSPALNTAAQQARDQLDQEIETLYQETRTTVANSPAVTRFCLNGLKEARLLSLTGSKADDLAKARSYIELVRSKLARSSAAMAHFQSGQIAGIVAWTLASLAMALPLSALPWMAPSGVVGSLRIPTGLLPLIAALGWGTIGGVAGTLYHLPWFVQLREYDGAYLIDYLSRPPKGFLLGGAVFLALFLGTGVLNLTILPAGTRLDSPLVLLAAIVAGFHQDRVAKLAAAALQSATRRTGRAASTSGT